MKTILFLLFVSLFGSSIRAQEWQTYTQTDAVVIQYKVIEVNDVQNGMHHKRVVFRYENLTSVAVQLTFNRSVIYSDSEESKPQEKTYAVAIPANSFVEYNELNATDKTYYLFSQDIKKSIKTSLVNFELKNVLVD